MFNVDNLAIILLSLGQKVPKCLAKYITKEFVQEDIRKLQSLKRFCIFNVKWLNPDKDNAEPFIDSLDKNFTKTSIFNIPKEKYIKFFSYIDEERNYYLKYKFAENGTIEIYTFVHRQNPREKQYNHLNEFL